MERPLLPTDAAPSRNFCSTGWSDEQVEEAFMRWRYVTEAFKER